MKLKTFSSDELVEKISFTVLIPFRDEEENIEKCTQRVLNQKYPAGNIEIIALNDHSTDNSDKIVEGLSLKNFNLKLQNLTSENGKKQAIEKGVSIAKSSWIITLDADCIVGENWLETLNQYVQQKEKEYVVMPVIFHQEKNPFEKIQSLEFLTLVATSASCIQGKKPLMSNGANTAFTKELFNAVNGFEGNKNISSGDDVFLMQKIKESKPESIGYLHHQDVIVSTHASSSLKDFIQQRVRWGSKSRAYKSFFSKGIAWLILMINLLILSSFIFTIFNKIPWKDFLILFLVKYVLDSLFIHLSTPFYGKKHLRIYVPFLSILYPIYIFVISFLSFVYRPSWKGRKINTD